MCKNNLFQLYRREPLLLSFFCSPSMSLDCLQAAKEEEESEEQADTGTVHLFSFSRNNVYSA